LLNSKIAIDNVLRSDFLLALQEKLTKVNFVAGGKLISTLRRIKTEEEKDLMMKIGSIHDRVFQKAISSIENGISEMQIAEVIVNGFKEWGAKCGSEIPTVGSGLYSALPHYRATEKMISCGDSIILDCCGILNHYYSDMTRTVFVGEPSEEYLKVYDTVRIAQETAFKSVKPGKTCEEIDKVARDIIEDAGYGKYFIHRTGHGIGLEVHEEPYIVKGNKLALEPGMTFSIEPGIYLPNKFGVRIEDCVFVTETGAESFTKLSHDLITIR
jgi:Xaa-Pro dipeptidase